MLSRKDLSMECFVCPLYVHELFITVVADGGFVFRELWCSRCTVSSPTDWTEGYGHAAGLFDTVSRVLCVLETGRLRRDQSIA